MRQLGEDVICTNGADNKSYINIRKEVHMIKNTDRKSNNSNDLNMMNFRIRVISINI